MKHDLVTHLATGAQIVVLAAVGGALGYAGFFLMLRQGFFALVLPGGLLGLAASLPRNRWFGWAVICGLAALALGLFADWRAEPFQADHSLGYYLAHAHQVQPIPLLMIVVGAAIGFWGPFSRYRQSKSAATKA
jgi:hypothetical protein